MKHYIFDFDGTLVDSMPDWSKKMIRVLKLHGVDYPPDIIKTLTTLGDRGSANYFREVFGVTASIETLFSQMDEYALPCYRDKIVLKEGVFDYLNYLKGEGYSLNVLTASPHKMLDPCLKRNGVWELFDNVWSTDDFGLPKSDTKIYHEVAEKLGIKTGDAVFFDDNIDAIKTAKASGMHTVGVYDASAESFKDDMKRESDIYVMTLSELCGKEIK